MMVATIERQALQRQADLQPPQELGAQTPVGPALQGKLVLIRGEMSTSTPLLDRQFDVKQPALGLKKETSRFDGKSWTKAPDQTQYAGSAQLGNFRIGENLLQACPDWTPFPLTHLPAKSGFRLQNGEAISNHPKPKKGDLRVRFLQLCNGSATALGHLQGKRFVGRVRLGSHSWLEMDPSATSMRPPPPVAVWVPRGFGWILMSLGLGLSYPLALAMQPKIRRLGCLPYATGLAAGLVAISVLCAPASASLAFLGLVLVSAIPAAITLQAWSNRPPDKPVWQD